MEDGRPQGLTSLADVERLIDPADEIEGCYLLEDPAARALLGGDPRPYKSQRNGAGPLAWNHHWLIVPLRDEDGRLVGRLWPDDPADLLLPSRQTLRVLRIFANQAVAAMVGAADVDKLQRLARRDDLTGVLNRFVFFERLEDELERCRRFDERLTLVLCDLDRLKAINDEHGHPTGDAALRRFARVLEGNVRSTDVVGRVGGDEFGLILTGSDPADAERALARIRTELEDDGGDEVGVRGSFGSARAPDNGHTRPDLVAVADARLYEDKRRRTHTARLTGTTSSGARRRSDEVQVRCLVVIDRAGAGRAPPPRLQRAPAGAVADGCTGPAMGGAPLGEQP